MYSENSCMYKLGAIIELHYRDDVLEGNDVIQQLTIKQPKKIMKLLQSYRVKIKQKKLKKNVK